MTTLSKEAKLSRKYTNHCVRSTTITILDQKGYEARHIMSVSGHKKVESIQAYAAKTPNTKKRQMSDSLSHALGGVKEPKIIATPPETCRPFREACKGDDPKPPPPACTVGHPVQNSFDYSFKDLLELSQEEEQQVLNDIFNTDMVYKEPVNKAVAVNNTFNQVSNVQNVNPPEKVLNTMASSIMPKMMFNNSSVTINFNINK